MDDQKLTRALTDIYGRLYKRYGPQHWWPAEEPFEVIVGAILTQSAAWTNVEKAINNLKKADALTPEALRELPEPELARLIFPSGYYNVKARKLKAFTGWLGAKFNDSLEKLFILDTNGLRSQLLGVYGIGEETADSILLYAGNKPVFVIDAYTRRIIDRLGLAPSPNAYSDYQKFFMAALPHDATLYNEYHALLVRLAKENCRKKPVCTACCLKNTLKKTRKSTISRFPCSEFLR
jgi:endonuclease-3 related protein